MTTGNDKQQFDPNATVRIVKVEIPGDNGSDVFDAEAVRMPPELARKYISRCDTRLTVPEPHWSFNAEIRAQQEALYNKRVAAAAKATIPVQIFHGKTGREEGYYVVRGAGVWQRR